MLSPQPPDPQLHRRLGQRELELLDLGSLSSLSRVAVLTARARHHVLQPSLARLQEPVPPLPTVFPVVPCRLAASAIVSSPDNTASTTRIRSSTGNCECPRRLISQSSQPGQ